MEMQKKTKVSGKVNFYCYIVNLPLWKTVNLHNYQALSCILCVCSLCRVLSWTDI